MSAPGRNAPCPCGSGRKFKQCCGHPKSAATVPRSNTTPLPAKALIREAARLNTAGRAAEAVALLQQAIQAEPDSGAPFLALGIILEDAGDRSQAITCFKRAVTLTPALAEAHARLGGLLAMTGFREDAVRHLNSAAAAAPNTVFGLVCRARAFLVVDNLTDAEVWARRAVTLDPRHAEANRMLGAIQSIHGRFDEAADRFERALAADPRDVTAYLGLMRSRTVTDLDLPLLVRMRAMVEGSGLSEPQRMTLHFALGKALEDLGDWQGAWAQYAGGNRLRARQGRVDRAAFAARIDRLIAAFGAGAFPEDNNSNLEHAGPEPIFVLGMPRSGTTLVEQIVSSHPNVAGAGELRYWTGQGAAWDIPGASAPDGHVAVALAREYQQVLQDLAPQARFLTDKNPFNFLWIGLIRRSLPRALILHCRRSRLDTCLSIHTTQFAAPMDFAADQEDLAFVFGEYERLMGHWHAVLDPSRFIDVQYEALIEGGESGIRDLIARCGLTWSEHCLRPELNPRPVRTASLWQARQPVYRGAVGRWRKFQPWLGTLIRHFGLSST